MIEVKATNWDRIPPHRMRATALRHTRQLWRYLNTEAYGDGTEVCPGLIYQQEPSDPGIRTEVESVMDERVIAVVWHSPSAGAGE